MSAIDFYIRVVQALDEIGAPYMIVGAFAGTAFGIQRATYDVDILVSLREQDFDTLSAKFPLPRYYADPEMMRNSVALGIMFNLIDTQEGVKADLVPLSRKPDYDEAFQRRVRRNFTDQNGVTFEAWCAQPTDIIIGKLQAWTEGQSAKHPADILNMLVFALSGLSDQEIDLQIIQAAVSRLGTNTLSLWNELLVRAYRETQKQI